MPRVQFTIALVFVGFVSSLANAGAPQIKSHWSRFWHQTHLDWERNNAWPEPFRHMDRQALRNSWTPYVNKGWQIETTLTARHFNAETQALNSAGEAKVRWIATSAPNQRRTIFVVRGESQDVTETRVDIVQQAVTRVLPTGTMPAVVRTYRDPSGIIPSGDYQNQIWKKAMSGIREPVLPGAAGGGGTP